ncbi:6-phosphogluconolactonase [Streptomyces bohaiensis]|uniref:6-phosphogluconolactonase n=1 Tax=Streptomyces bohaiensis TaxID=1431344 RepID=UPI0030C66D29
MSDSPEVVVHRDTEVMAHATAARLLTALADAQAARGTASVVLTGGRNGNALLAALAASPARDAVDWSALEIWWGDERYLPDGDPDRNATQAQDALLGAVGVDPARVHPMPCSDGAFGADVAAAAAWYARELAAAAGPGAPHGAPAFDVLLLGVGPDTHVASLFPGHPGFATRDAAAVAVTAAPKPPPTRISLTVPAIRSARQVWLLAAGEDKAGAVAEGLAAPADGDVPAGAARGRERTLWLLDRAAAGTA